MGTINLKYKVRTSAIIAVCLLALLNTFSVFATGTLILNLDLASGYTGPFSPGDEVQYRISFACNSLQEGCGDLLITSSLDPNLDIVSLEVPPGFTGNVSGQDISIQRSDYQDGSAAEALITVRIDESASPDVDIDTTFTGTILEADDGVGTVTSTLTIDVEEGTFNWDVGKSLIAPANADPALDTDTTYQVEVFPETSTGNVGLSTLTVVDTYPAGAIVVDATGDPPPVIDTANRTITWNYTDVPANSGGFSEEVTLRFPSETFDVGDTVLNAVSSTGLPVSGSTEVDIGGSGIVVVISDDIRETTVDKNQSQSVLAAGGTGRFYLDLQTDTSNVPLDGVILGDTMPVDGSGNPVFDIVEIISGRWNPDVAADIYICCDSTLNEALLGTVNGSSRVTFTPADFPGGLTSDNITSIEWRFTEPVPLTFNMFDEPEIVFTPLSGNAGQSFTNVAYSDVTDNTSGSPATDDVETDVIEGSTNVRPRKSVLNSGAPPNGLIQFEARVDVTEASSQPLNGLVIRDLLPPELVFVSWDEVTFSSGIPTSERVLPNLVVTPVGDRTELLWVWGDTVPEGAVQLDGDPGVPNPLTITEPEFGNRRITVVFSARVAPGVPPGTYRNEMTLVTDVDTLVCVGSVADIDSSDFDNDGVTDDDTTCTADSDFTVTEAAALSSSEWIQGDPSYPNVMPEDPANTDCPDDGTDTGFTRFPCVAQAEIGGPFQYKMRIANSGNVPITDYIAYNILPYVGDTGSGQPLSATPRESDWRAFLTGPVAPSNAFARGLGLTIEYSDSTNPCRPEVARADNIDPWQADCVDDWTATPDNFRDVRAFRIISLFGSGNSDPFFQPADEMEFLVPMRINDNAAANTIAWNSFAQRARDAISGELLETAEPRKVGILAQPRLVTDEEEDEEDDVDRVLLAASASSLIPANNSNLAQSQVIGESRISKSADPFFALAGDQVTWTVTLANPTAAAQGPVGFDDAVPDNMTILSADAPMGNVSVNGQVVQYRLDNLAPNTSVTVRIVTRIKPDTAMPFIITNSLNEGVSAQVISVNVLPSTGESPWWRGVLSWLGVLLIGLGGVALWRWKRQGHAGVDG